MSAIRIGVADLYRFLKCVKWPQSLVPAAARALLLLLSKREHNGEVGVYDDLTGAT